MNLRNEDLTWQEIDDEIIVLDLRASSYLKLNGTGALLWKQLAAGSDEQTLVNTLTATYEVAVEQAERDVEAFVRRLERAQLLEPSR